MEGCPLTQQRAVRSPRPPNRRRQHRSLSVVRHGKACASPIARCRRLPRGFVRCSVRSSLHLTVKACGHGEAAWARTAPSPSHSINLLLSSSPSSLLPPITHPFSPSSSRLPLIHHVPLFLSLSLPPLRLLSPTSTSALLRFCACLCIDGSEDAEKILHMHIPASPRMLQS